MSASTEQVQPESQSTPLANDILRILRGQLRGGGPMAGPPSLGDISEFTGIDEDILDFMGPDMQDQLAAQMPQQRQGALDASAFGTGVGPLQREAGTAARQFVNSGAPALPEELSSAIDQTQETARSDAMAELGEQFGQAGNLLGTPSQVGQAQLLSRLVPQQTRERFNQRRAFGQQQLQAMDLLSIMGQRNINPFLALAGKGIMPEDTVVKQNPFISTLSALGGAAQGAGSVMSAV